MRGLLTLCLLAGCDGVFGLGTFTIPDAQPTGLIAWYPLDDAGGTTFADASMHGHTGTCASPMCPTAASGHVAGAMRFDGIDDRIDIAGDGELETTGGFTAALWIWIDDITHAGCPINKQYGTSNADSWQLCLDGTGVVYLFSTGANAMSTIALTAGAWHHLALRFDLSEATISIDGSDVGVVLDTITYDADTVTLGSDAGGGEQAPFAGMLDDVRIYDHALTRGEIQVLANQ